MRPTVRRNAGGNAKGSKISLWQCRETLQKDQNGADIPDKGRFLNNITRSVKQTLLISVVCVMCGLSSCRCNIWKILPCCCYAFCWSVSELASRVIITTAPRTAGDRWITASLTDLLCLVAGLTGALCLWNVLAISKQWTSHPLNMMSNKGDDLRSVFYVDGAAFLFLRLSKMACQYPHLVLISC